MANTKIEWTVTINPDGSFSKGKVWNPVTGCTKVSQGCAHCYAETIAGRFWAKQYPANEDGSPRRFTDVRFHPERLELPLRWMKPQKIFVNSMSDLFHESLNPADIVPIFNVMWQAKQHTFFILTKRPSRMLDFAQRLTYSNVIDGKHYLAVTGKFNRPASPVVLPNVWLGVSVEDQATADERIPLLLDTPADRRFVSCEPLLREVDLTKIGGDRFGWGHKDVLSGLKYIRANATEGGSEWETKSIPKLDWVICGGESGPDARPMHPDWARSLRDQCQAAGVPFFFKQWGTWLPAAPHYPEGDGEANLDGLDLMAHTICFGNQGTLYQEDQGLELVYWCGYQPDPGQNPWFFEKVGKKTAGRELFGLEWNEFPEVR